MQVLVGPGQAHRLAGVILLGEGLDGRPVDDPVRRGHAAPASGTQPAQQAGEPDIGPHQAHHVVEPGQVQVGGTEHAHAVHVDHLVVDHVLVERHLAGPALGVTQVESGRAELDLATTQRLDLRSGHPGLAAAHLDQQAGHRRIGLALPAHHHVVDGAHLATGLVAHRGPDQPGHRDERTRDALVGEQARRGPTRARRCLEHGTLHRILPKERETAASPCPRAGGPRGGRGLGSGRPTGPGLQRKTGKVTLGHVGRLGGSSCCTWSPPGDSARRRGIGSATSYHSWPADPRWIGPGRPGRPGRLSRRPRPGGASAR